MPQRIFGSPAQTGPHFSSVWSLRWQGSLIRALASGHIRKNAALATTGPYAYTRNPLYLGSIIIALGFIVAARNLWIGVATLAMFAFIYLPVIKAEENYLRSAFPGYDRYASEVPRLSAAL